MSVEQSETYPCGGVIHALKIVCQHREVTIHSLRWLSSGEGYTVSVKDQYENELGKGSFVNENGVGKALQKESSVGGKETSNDVYQLKKNEQWHKV